MGIIAEENVDSRMIRIKLELTDLAKRVIEYCYRLAAGEIQTKKLSAVIDTGELPCECIDELDEYMEELTAKHHEFCVPLEELSGLRVGKGTPYKVRLTKELVSNGLIDSRTYYLDTLKFKINFQTLYSEEVGGERIFLSKRKYAESKVGLREISEDEYDSYDDDVEARLEKEFIFPSLLNFSGRERRPNMTYNFRNGTWVNDNETDDN